MSWRDDKPTIWMSGYDFEDKSCTCIRDSNELGEHALDRRLFEYLMSETDDPLERCFKKQVQELEGGMADPCCRYCKGKMYFRSVTHCKKCLPRGWKVICFCAAQRTDKVEATKREKLRRRFICTKQQADIREEVSQISEADQLKCAKE